MEKKDINDREKAKRMKKSLLDEGFSFTAASMGLQLILR